MFYKKQGRPEVGDIVICTVKKILYHSVFVTLDEYRSVEGMIHISEISPGRIRNLRDYVTEGKRLVCKILSIKGNNIDLSLRRVNTTVRIKKSSEYKQENKAEKLLTQIGKEVGFDIRKIYEQIGFKAREKYGGLYPFLQDIVESGKKVIDEFNPDKKFGELLFKVVKEKIKPIEVNIGGTLDLKSYSENGIEDIKTILLEAEKNKIKVGYLGAPKYKLDIVAKNYKIAEAALKKFLDVAYEIAKKANCEMNFVKND